MSAFKEAGFHTYWLSNQQPYGFYDNPITVYAKEADQTVFINPAGYQFHSTYDGDLLKPFNQALSNQFTRKFI